MMRFFKVSMVTGLFLLLGAGCTARVTDGGYEAEVLGETARICLRNDEEAVGEVRVMAAKITPGAADYSQWFKETALVTGLAGEELCGDSTFKVIQGDDILLNGDWQNGQRWLVENRTPDASGSDVIKELWINDQYYAVGEECEYKENGLAGFDVLCTVR